MSVITLNERIMAKQKCSGDALTEWIDKSGVSHGDLAKALGVEYQQLWRVMTSRSRPGWPLLMNILRVTKGEVDANSFTLPLATESPDFDPVTKEELEKRTKRRRPNT